MLMTIEPVQSYPIVTNILKLSLTLFVSNINLALKYLVFIENILNSFQFQWNGSNPEFDRI